jgi:hypothetical protein
MQTRNDYWWLFLEQLEQLYLLSLGAYDRETTSHFYGALTAISDFILGESRDFGQGVVYGYKMVPRDQNAQSFYSSGSFSYENPSVPGTDPNAENYDIKCINKEYESMPFGPPTISYGSLFSTHYANDPLGATMGHFSSGRLFDNGLETTETSVISEITPPDDLQELLLTSTTYMIIYNGVPVPITLFFSGNDASPMVRGAHAKDKLNLKTYDPSWHIKNIDNTSVFPAVPAGAIEISRTVWRIGTTMTGSAEYEYYIIDARQPYGYYGWNQFECVAILKGIYNRLIADYNMVDTVKDTWSIVFNDMQWGSAGFLGYWVAQGYTPSATMIALYNELHI